MICPNCNHKNEDGAIFCGNCGTKLEDAAVTEKPEEKKTYSFSIEVAADSRVEAREKLERLLKNVPKGDFIIRG